MQESATFCAGDGEILPGGSKLDQGLGDIRGAGGIDAGRGGDAGKACCV
jgi:hypothetical protein